MSNKAGKRLVPVLRFPEFRREAGWEIQPLRKLAKLIEDRAGTEKYTLLSVTSGVGLVTQIEKFGREIAGNQYKNYFVIRRGDFAYNKSATIKDPEGFIALLESHEQAAVPNSIFTCFRLKNESNSPQFFKHLFSTNIHGNWLRRFITIGARANGSLNIDSNDLLSLPLGLPTSLEQRKIADCLSSIDDLIVGQAKKIEALKAHKKGLMQLLFPAEDETLPKLRFPEFREAEEWEEKRLGDIGSVRMCKRILKEQTSPSGDIPFYKIGTFGGVADAYISLELFGSYRNNFPFPKNGAVLISAAGTIGRTVRYNGELAYFQDSNIVWLDNNENLIADNFLFYLYQLMKWAPSIGAIQRLYNDNILGATIKFPAIPEQQKIANCLSSLDDLITAQTQKLETLKTQKAGLMQGLFPSMAEAEA